MSTASIASGQGALDRRLPRRRLIREPVSAYRIQFHGQLGFGDAARLVPYLARLGVTDVYASPYLMAKPGSAHGYDICDHNRLNPELGDAADYEAFCHALSEHALGQILDFVPNHMGIDPRTNLWWRDVLENGPSSPFADFFDVDWDPVKPELRNKVLLPVLGDQYGSALERSELQLEFVDGALELTYFDHRFPINPRQTPRVFQPGLDELCAALGEDDAHVRELLSVMTALHNLPVYTEREPARIAERQREKEVARERFARLVHDAPEIRRFVGERVRMVNGIAGQPRSFDLLHELLEWQAYRLAYWRTAADEINYRRFFDINDLACLRMEDRRVFDAAHGLVLKLIGEGKVAGLRIDHLDGLFNPREYLVRLADAVADALAGARGGEDASPPTAVYTVAEKILSHGETLSDMWPHEGTTGYELLNAINGLFIDARNGAALSRLYARVTHRKVNAIDELYESKKLIMLSSMSAELNVLAHALNRLSERDRRSRDFTLDNLRKALREIIACFPVYRTYVEPAGATPADTDALETAIASARRRNPVMEASIFDFVRDHLVPSSSEGDDQIDHPRRRFAMQFQQYTGPVQAKGVEDTAFYRHAVLLSLNEVGGDLTRLGETADEFHRMNVRRQRCCPLALSSTNTHDTKRGEDARARLNVLSEIPEAWASAVRGWMRANASLRTILHGHPAPDRADEYLFYQALVGAWPPELLTVPPPASAPPAFVDRLQAYMTKAIKEAKRHSSWLNEDRTYELATARFVQECLAGELASRFLATFVPFVTRIARAGVVNSLAQLALKLTVPGVPDCYQGSELWDFSLVDPDNRRPVDFDLRCGMLSTLEASLEMASALEQPGCQGPEVEGLVAVVSDLLEQWQDGRIKLFLTARGLRLRRDHPALFKSGDYEPLNTDEEGARHLVAFVRQLDEMTLIAIVPRMTMALRNGGAGWPVGLPVWGTMRIGLPPALGRRTYRHLLTGEKVEPLAHGGDDFLLAARVFATCPVAWLYAD